MTTWARSGLATTLGLAGLLAMTSGCGGDPGGSGVVIDTLASGVVRVRNPDRGTWGDGGWRAVAAVSIGEMEGADPYIFGDVRDAELGPDGRIYVLDNQAKEVRIFGPEGRHQATFGREGAGPGEFRNPTGLTWGPDGNLWVMDAGNQRYTVVSPDGELVTSHAKPPSGGWSWSWDGTFDDEGGLLEADFVGEPGTDERRRAIVRRRFDAGEAVTTDTFEIPSFDGAYFQVELTNGGNVMRMSTSVPFSPILDWEYDGAGGLWAGSGDGYRLWHTTLAGDTTRLVELDRPRPPVSGAERDSAEAHINEAFSGPALAQIDLSRIPDTKPSFRGLLVDDAGCLWVERMSGGTYPYPPISAFDVFDPEGRFLGTVQAAAEQNPAPVIRGNRMAAVVTDDLGVERVVVYRIDGRTP